MMFKTIFQSIKNIAFTKVLFRNTVPDGVTDVSSYMLHNLIEEIAEVHLDKESIHGYLEVTDMVGLYFLMCEQTGIQAKKFLPVNTDPFIKSLKLIESCTHFLRFRYDKTSEMIILGELHDSIAAFITYYGKTFEVDFYYLANISMCLSTVKMLSRMKLHEFDLFMYTKSDLLLHKVLLHLKHVCGKLKVLSLYNMAVKQSKGEKAW